MTPEQWQDEFRKELDKLSEPIDRLCALITLTPKYYSHEDLIRKALDNRANIHGFLDKQKNNSYSRVDTASLERLYQLLKFLPRPTANQDYLKKYNALSEIQLFALGEILAVYTDEDSDEDDLVLICEHWRELLQPLENEIGYERGLARLIAETKPNLTRSDIERQIDWMSKSTHCTLLNAHPWNQKARELLDVEGVYCPSDQLHIITLMDYGLNNKGERMRKILRELQNRCGMYELEWKPAEMAGWKPIQAMFYITSGTDYDRIHDLPDLMEAGTPLEGAIALLYHLVALMESRHEI